MRVATAAVTLAFVAACSGGSNQPPTIASFECDPLTGPAPLTSTCSWSVSDADGDSMSCGIDVGNDGNVDFPYDSCPNHSSQAVTINDPGTLDVQFAVTDFVGNTSTSRVTLTATTPDVIQPPGDIAPSIDAFDVSPDDGFAPLNAQFTFSVSDGDGDATTCVLTENGNVVSDEAPCGQNETRSVTFDVGSHDVTLTVNDGYGGSATATKTVTATMNTNPAVGDLRISKIEWGQSTVSTSLRLVAGKDALLRVYVLADHAGMNNVAVKIAGTKGSTSLGELTLTGPTTTPMAEASADLSQQWHVVVPGTWISSGFNIAVHVDPDNQINETNESNNDQTVTPTVGAGNVLPITNVPITSGGRTGHPLDNLQGLKQIWPLKTTTVTTRATYTTAKTLGPTTNWDTLLDELSTVRMSDGSSRDYVGWVNVTYGSGIAGIGYVGDPTCLSRDDDVFTSVHELGHNMGRNHAPCGGASGVDPNYPVSTAHLDVQGWDYVTGKLMPASTNYDIMSYCDPQWVSAYNYKAVQTWLEQNVSSPPTTPPTASPRIIVSGSLSGDSISIQPLVAVAGVEALNTHGEYTVTVFSHTQRVSVPFDVKTVADVEKPLFHFSVLVPDLGEIEAVEISRGTQVLARKLPAAVHAGVPKVTVEKAQGGVNVKWDASEYAFASVAHVADDGRTTLSLWREGGSAFVSTQGLTEGGAFEVSLSDGVATKRLMVAR